ncbi:MAG: hypothetical protein ACPIOQ_25800 [Promethearchaeia archaeon]
MKGVHTIVNEGSDPPGSRVSWRQEALVWGAVQVKARADPHTYPTASSLPASPPRHSAGHDWDRAGIRVVDGGCQASLLRAQRALDGP